MFINFLIEKFPHLRFAYKTDQEMGEHFLSGEVTVPIPDLLKYVDEWDKKRIPEDHTSYPSRFELRQVVKLKFRTSDEPLTATVRGIHFFDSKVKYDLGLWLGDGSVDNPETETRIYNVDSVFVTPA